MEKNQSKRLSYAITTLAVALLISTGTLFSQQSMSQLDQNETTAVSQSSIFAVNLTGIVNQTDGNLIGIRPMNPIFCETNPDLSLCKDKSGPIPDNKCIRRPGVCDPCNDPRGICPTPKEVEQFFATDSQQNLTSTNTSNVQVVDLDQILENAIAAINNGNYTEAIRLLNSTLTENPPSDFQGMRCADCTGEKGGPAFGEIPHL